MQIFLFVLFLLAWPDHHPQTASEIDGYWTGAIEVYDQELNIQITFSFTDGILDGVIDIPQQDAYNLPVEVLEVEEEIITFQFETGTGPAVFRGRWDADNNTIEGEFEQVGEKFPFKLTKQRPSGPTGSQLFEEEIIVPTQAGQISGNLLLQENPAPLVIMLSGAGSQDRDENVAGFRLFGTLSAELFESGFSSFRFDDRGIGQSQGEEDATLQELAKDLVDIMDYLKSNHEDQITGLVLIGHNQGGLVASLAAKESDVSGLIFMASPFLRGDEIIKEQIRLISERRDISEEVMQVNLDFQNRIFEVVRTGSDWDEVEQDLAQRLRAQIDQLPDQQREALGDMDGFIQSQINRQLSTAKSRWFKSLIELEPADVISELKEIQMLAVFGEKDTQVPAASNIEVCNQISSDPELDLDVVVIDHANHLFQQANTGMPSEYGMLGREFTDDFINAVLNFLNKF